MNTAGNAAHDEWAADSEQSMLLDEGESDSSSKPLVRKHSAMPTTIQRGFLGSPRRNGMVLDVNVRSIFGLRAAGNPHRRNRNRTPDTYRRVDSEGLSIGTQHIPNVSAEHITAPPAIDQMTDTASRRCHESLLPPSISDLSLQSADSESSWLSPSSTPSRKHSLEPSFDGSPQPKRRLMTEMGTIAASFRNSAPSCVQSRFDADRTERQGGGLLRRSGADIQSLLSTKPSDDVLQPITSYFDAEWEKAGEARGTAFPDLFCSRPETSHYEGNTVPDPYEKREVRRRKGYSFWRFSSPPIPGSTSPELGYGEEPASRQDPISEHQISNRAEQTNTRPRSDIWPTRVSSIRAVEEGTGARLDAQHSLVGTQVGTGAAETADNVGSGNHSEENPILMCGKRLYSDWTGYWNGVPRKIPGAGTLFPEGYYPRIGDPNPWICPIRDCQTIFADAWALGGHFSASHRACLLNDNLDGTLSIVGKRKTADPSSGRMPPVVISRNAIDAANAPPKASPRRPGRRKKAGTGQQREAGQGVKGKEGEDSVECQDDSAAPSTFSPRSSNLLPVEASAGESKPNSSKPNSSKPNSSKASRPLTPVSITLPDTPPQEELRKPVLWEYLMMYLPHSTPLPENPTVVELLALPRQRELPHRWKFQLAGGHPTVKTLCAVLVYIGGVKGHTPCDVCAGGGDKGQLDASRAPPIRPFPECIALPAGVSVELKQYFGETACCNRFYQSADGGKGGYCASRFSLSSSDLGGETRSVDDSVVEETPAVPPSQDAREDEDNDNEDDSSDTDIAFSPSAVRSSPGYKTALPARVAGRPRMVSIRKGKAGSTSPTGGTKAKRQSSIRRLAAKLGGKAARREVAVYKPSESAVTEEDPQEAEKQSVTATETSTGGSRRSRRLLEQQREQPRPESKQSALSKLSGVGGSPSKSAKLRKREKKSSTAGSDISRASQEAVPSASLMMADWEIAPGRIRVGTGANAENIAYSSSYLAQGRAVSITEGIMFQVIEIQPGGSLQWAAEESRTRLCSVARGIIRVQLPEKEFPIGPNGMWKVRQGAVCTLVNPLYLGAVVHVTTFDDVT